MGGRRIRGSSRAVDWSRRSPLPLLPPPESGVATLAIRLCMRCIDRNRPLDKGWTGSAELRDVAGIVCAGGSALDAPMPRRNGRNRDVTGRRRSPMDVKALPPGALFIERRVAGGGSGLVVADSVRPAFQVGEVSSARDELEPDEICLVLII